MVEPAVEAEDPAMEGAEVGTVEVGVETGEAELGTEGVAVAEDREEEAERGKVAGARVARERWSASSCTRTLTAVRQRERNAPDDWIVARMERRPRH